MLNKIFFARQKNMSFEGKKNYASMYPFTWQCPQQMYLLNQKLLAFFFFFNLAALSSKKKTT